LARIVSYVLVQLAPGNAGSIARAISKIHGVKMAHAVTGPFDVIAYVEVPDLEALSDLVLSRVQKVKGVEKTQTAVVVAPTPSSVIIKRARSRKKA
jgi:DNA-binding Lrp family transcriptional regulator